MSNQRSMLKIVIHDSMLKTLRFFPLSDGPENCYYIENIPAGRYQIWVFFGLIADPILASEPIFNLSVEGAQFATLKPSWSGFDEQSFAEAIVDIADTSASICFHGTGHGDPSSWRDKVVLRPVKRLSSGTGKPAFDEDMNGTQLGGGRFWKPIKSFSTGDNRAISTENVIAETSVSSNFYPQALYQSAIIGTEGVEMVYELSNITN